MKKIYLHDVKKAICGIATMINVVASIILALAISNEMRDPEGFPSAMGLLGLLPFVIIALIARYLHIKLSYYSEPRNAWFWIIYTIYVLIAFTSITLYFYCMFSNK